MVTILRPGENIGLPLPDVTASSNLKTASFSIKDFVTHLVPTSIFAALAGNEMLQIVVFAIFFGLGAAALGELTKPMILLIDQVGAGDAEGHGQRHEDGAAGGVRGDCLDDHHPRR